MGEAQVRPPLKVEKAEGTNVMTSRQYTYINSGMVSGAFNLNTALGGYWEVTADTATGEVSNYSFFSMADNVVETSEGDVLDSNLIYAVKSGIDQTIISSSGTSLPLLEMPIRLVGNKDYIENDSDWLDKASRVASMAAFINTSFKIDVPYSPLYIKRNDYDNLSSYNLAQISYDYNYYLPEYESRTAASSMLETPNYYYYLSKYIGLEESESVTNYVTVENNVLPESIFDSIYTNYPPTYDITSADLDLTTGKYIDRLHNSKLYFSSSFGFQLSSSTMANISKMSRNLYFNTKTQAAIFGPHESLVDKFPYTIKINIPAYGRGIFGDMIEDAGYENVMLDYMKNYFVEDTQYLNNSLGLLKRDFVTQENNILINQSIANDLQTPEVNFYSMVMHTLADSQATYPDNFYIIAGQHEEREKIINPTSKYRYSRSIPSLKLLNNVKSYLDANFYFSTTSELKLQDILDKTEENQHNEVIAYRINKVDQSTGQQQDFFFTSLNTLQMFDTQVRYGSSYKYTVYAYCLTSGYRYAVTQLVVSRKIASEEITATEEVNCLEFYSPGTGIMSPALYYEENVLENELFTDSQVSSYDDYLADFKISVEPYIVVREIPIYSKSIGILDHPLPSVNVHKFQRMNNSKIIGMFTELNGFTPAPFPKPITERDKLYKASYMLYNDLLDGKDENIQTPCRSGPHEIEIFRTIKKPTSLSDYNEGTILNSKSLRLKEKQFNINNCLYEQEVNTNTKYYYILRAMSIHNSYGPSTNVIEAELVDDGGYLYAVFNELSEHELEKEMAKQITEQFKKVIHISPNINQLLFNTSDVDFNNAAHEERSNLSVGRLDEGIFNKTFKIRLTSKKTGKKIDLNVTYKLI